MWRMHVGDRAMTEAEWALFSTALDLLRDSIEEDIRAQSDDAETGVPAFDQLTPEQKLVLLADTAHALRDPATPTPRHTAANEGAIAAVFSMMRVELEAELDIDATAAAERPTDIRRMLLAVCREAGDREEPLPDVTSTEADQWDSLLEKFEGLILWDIDYAMGDEFLDLPPDEARVKLQRCGIDPEYYLAVPDEPDEARLTAARQTLARLLGLPVPDDDGLYPALDDLYHDLKVAPCSAEQAAIWEGNPWVQAIRMTEPGGDCDFPTWEASFCRALPPTPFRLAPGTPDGVHDLPGGLRVERRGDAWVVRDERGSYWCGLLENGWTDDPDEEAMPALAFPTEAEAWAAYAQAGRMYGDRAERRRQAIERLGLDDD